MQVVNGLTSLLANGSSATGNLSSLESYNTALSFVQALGRTLDSNGNTTAVSLSKFCAKRGLDVMSLVLLEGGSQWVIPERD